MTLTPQRPKNALAAWGFAPPEPVKVEKVKPAKKPRMKVDPAHVVKARELRDRYLEQFNDPVNGGMILPSGKYAVCRQIEATPAGFVAPPPLLEQRAA